MGETINIYGESGYREDDIMCVYRVSKTVRDIYNDHTGVRRCHCEGGVPATGSDCTKDGDLKCMSCFNDDDYFDIDVDSTVGGKQMFELIDGICQPICECKNGQPAYTPGSYDNYINISPEDICIPNLGQWNDNSWRQDRHHQCISCNDGYTLVPHWNIVSANGRYMCCLPHEVDDGGHGCHY